MTWERGREVLQRLLLEGRLERISGAAADGSHWLNSAAALLESAERECDRNPEAAYVLAYDAARKASTALIAQQGLRTRSDGHHVTVIEVVRAQFGGPFDALGAMRRRRAEVEYPQTPGDDIGDAEARQAVEAAERVLGAAAKLIAQLTIFR